MNMDANKSNAAGVKYLLQRNDRNPSGWVLTDRVLKIVLTFDEGKFNETQKFTPLNNDTTDVMILARAAHEMTDFLLKNHRNLL